MGAINKAAAAAVVCVVVAIMMVAMGCSWWHRGPIHAESTTPGSRSTDPSSTMPNDDENVYDLIIIGAGWAGMAAADYISRRSNVSFAILESTNRTGGRSEAAVFGDKNGPGEYVVELGSMWITGIEEHPAYGDNPIHRLAQLSGIKVVEDEDIDAFEILKMSVFGRGGEDVDVNRTMRRTMDAALKCVESAFGDEMGEPKSMSDCGWNAKTGVEKAIESAFFECATSTATTADFGSFHVWGGEALVVDQDPRGYASLIDFMVGNNPTFPKNQIIFDSHVEKITYEGHFVTLLTRGGTSYYAKQVISTLPLGVLKHGHGDLFDPTLPNDTKHAFEQGSGAHMVHFTKLFLQFPQAWWNNSLTHWASTAGEGEFASWRNLNHEEMLKGSNMLLSIAPDPWSSQYDDLEDAQVKEKVMNNLRSQFPNVDIPDPSSFLLTRHSSDETRFGAYSTFDSCSSAYNFYRVFAEPLRNRQGQPKVRFAGESHCPAFFGYTHGAHLSGVETAAKYLHEVGLAPDPKQDPMLTVCHDVWAHTCQGRNGANDPVCLSPQTSSCK